MFTLYTIHLWIFPWQLVISIETVICDGVNLPTIEKSMLIIIWKNLPHCEIDWHFCQIFILSRIHNFICWNYAMERLQKMVLNRKVSIFNYWLQGITQLMKTFLQKCSQNILCGVTFSLICSYVWESCLLITIVLNAVSSSYAQDCNAEWQDQIAGRLMQGVSQTRKLLSFDVKKVVLENFCSIGIS